MQIWLIEKDSTNKNKGEKGEIPMQPKGESPKIPQQTKTEEHKEAENRCRRVFSRVKMCSLKYLHINAGILCIRMYVYCVCVCV